MKLTNRLRGVPTQPDYEMLRTALMAAQAATPTGRAAVGTPPDDPFAALNALFTSAESPTADGAALANRFARNPPGTGDAS